MATSKITCNSRPIYFSSTRDSQLASGGCYGYYYPVDCHVSLKVTFVSNNNIAAGSTLFTVPEAYRPISTALGACILSDSNGIDAVGAIQVTTEGNVIQIASNTKKMGIGLVEYYI